MGSARSRTEVRAARRAPGRTAGRRRRRARSRRPARGSSSSAAHEHSAKPPIRSLERARAVRRVRRPPPSTELAPWRRGRRAGRRCPVAAPRRGRLRSRAVSRRRPTRPGRAPSSRRQRRRRTSGSPITSIGAGAARRARGASTQPRLDGAVPAVDLQPHGGVDRLVGLGRQPAAAAELHAARRGAPPACERERDVAALRPSRAASASVRGRHEQRHRRVAQAERREPLELLGERERRARRRARPRRPAARARGPRA